MAASKISEPPHLATDLKTLCLATIAAHWELPEIESDDLPWVASKMVWGRSTRLKGAGSRRGVRLDSHMTRGTRSSS